MGAVALGKLSEEEQFLMARVLPGLCTEHLVNLVGNVVFDAIDAGMKAMLIDVTDLDLQGDPSEPGSDQGIRGMLWDLVRPIHFIFFISVPCSIFSMLFQYPVSHSYVQLSNCICKPIFKTTRA
jgi:hypothetical protein